MTLGTTTATGTIEDDDPIKASVAVAATVTEGVAAQFTVTLTSASSTADVVVTYTVGGTTTWRSVGALPTAPRPRARTTPPSPPAP